MGHSVRSIFTLVKGCCVKLMKQSYPEATNRTCSKCMLEPGKALQLVLFRTFKDRISRNSHGLEKVCFGDQHRMPLLSMEDGVPLASPFQDLQHAMGHFQLSVKQPGKWSAPQNARLYFSTKKRWLVHFKSESYYLKWKSSATWGLLRSKWGMDWCSLRRESWAKKAKLLV